MQTIVERAAYEGDESGFWGRMPFVVGVGYGAVMAAFGIWGADQTLPAALITGALSGALFGAVMSWWTRRTVTRLQRRIYDADPSIVPPLPDDVVARFSFRLPCGLVHSRTRVASGVLYLGNSGGLFVPVAKGPFRNDPHVVIEPIGDMEAELVPWSPNHLQKLLAPIPFPFMALSAGGKTLTLSVPTPALTLRATRAAMASLCS